MSNSDSVPAVLVVDLGAHRTRAALSRGGRAELLRDQGGTAWSWAASVCLVDGAWVTGTAAEVAGRQHPYGYRDAVGPFSAGDGDGRVRVGEASHPLRDLLAARLRAVARAALAADGLPDRTMMIVHGDVRTDTPAIATLLDAARDAGLGDVECVAASVAAAAAAGFDPGETVLVCDVGAGTADLAVVRTGPDGGGTVLARADWTGVRGQDVDRALTDRVLRNLPLGTDPALLTTPRTEQLLARLIRGGKEQLGRRAVVDEVVALSTGDVPVRFGTADLAPVLDGPLAELHRIGPALFDAAGVRPADLAGVVLAGAGSRLPGVSEAVAGLAPGVRRADGGDVESGPVEAVARGLATVPPPRLVSAAAPGRTRPLAWRLPVPGVVERWHVGPGEAFGAGQVLARIRDEAGVSLRIAAARPGILLAHVPPGTAAESGRWLATAGPEPDTAELTSGSLLLRSFAHPVACDVLSVAATGGAGASGGGLLVTGADDGAVRVWDAAGAERSAFRHGEPVSAIAVSPDGTALAMAADDGSVLFGGFGEADPRRRVEHRSRVAAIAFSPDGRSFATAGDNGAVRVWNADSGETALELRHEAAVTAVAFSADGTQLATAGLDRTALVWTLASGTVARRFPHETAVTALALDPRGEGLATGDSLGRVRFWDRADGRLVAASDPGSGPGTAEGAVLGCAYSADGRWLLTVGADDRVQVRAPADAAVLATVAAGHGALAACFTDAGSAVALVGVGGFAQVRRIAEVRDADGATAAAGMRTQTPPQTGSGTGSETPTDSDAETGTEARQ